MGYSPERKSAVLKRMLPPNNLAIRQLSQEEGISEGTLHKWRAEARGKGQLCLTLSRAPRAGRRVTSLRRCWKQRRSMRQIWLNIDVSAGFILNRSRHGSPLLNKWTTGMVPEQHVWGERPRMRRRGQGTRVDRSCGAACCVKKGGSDLGKATTTHDQHPTSSNRRCADR